MCTFRYYHLQRDAREMNQFKQVRTNPLLSEKFMLSVVYLFPRTNVYQYTDRKTQLVPNKKKL